MIISSLRYRSSRDGSTKAWRFAAGSGRLANTICVHDKGGDLQDALQAIHFALSGKASGPVREVALVLMDDTNKQWIIERGERGTRCLCNGDPASQEQIDRSLLGALFETDAAANNSGEEATVIYRELHHEIGQWSAYPLQLGNDQIRMLRQAARTRTDRIARETAALLHDERLTDPRLAVRLSRSLCPVLHAQRELTEQQKSIRERWGADFSNDTIGKLRSEVELMRRINAAAAPIIDPAMNPSVLNDKLRKTEDNLQTILNEAGMTLSHGSIPEHDWEQILETLARMDVFRRLVESSAKAREVAATNVKDALRKYQDICATSLQTRADGASEIESCLSSLAVQMRDIQETGRQSRGIVDRWIDKARWAAGFGDNMEGQAEAQQLQRLENVRSSIEFASKSIKELSKHLSQPQESEAKALSKIDEIHARLVTEYDSIRQRWQETVKSTGLPADMTLTKCLKLLNRFGKITDLNQRRQGLRNLLDNRKELLDRLATLLTEWRKATGSVKTASLENTSILISETRNLIHYLPEKEKQLAKWDGRREDTMIGISLAELNQKRQQALSAEWTAAFNAIGLQPLAAWDDPRWLTFFQNATQLEGLVAFQQDGDRIPGEKALVPPSLGTVFMVHSVATMGLNATQREEFIKLFSESSGLVFQILLVADQSLCETLVQKGSGRSTPINMTSPVNNRTGSPAATRPQPTTRVNPNTMTRPEAPPMQTRSEFLAIRARETVDVLNGKRNLR